MQYRVYGQDLTSKEARPPLDIEAESEQAARGRAAEMGMHALRVEAAGTIPAGPPVRPDRLAPPGEDRPGPGTPRAGSPTGRMLACLLLALMSLAVGVGIGFVLPHVSWVATGGPTVPGTALSSTAPNAGIRLETLTTVQEMFTLAGQKAVVLKYSGGDVDFWVELDVDGEKERFGELPSSRGNEPHPGPDQRVEGYLVWVRHEADDAGKERWKLAHRRDLITTQTSGIRISNPLAQASVSQTRADSQSTSQTLGLTFQVWKHKAMNGVVTSTSERITLPSLLPTDREVCVREVRAERKLTERRLAATVVGALGLLVVSPDGPLLAVSAVVPVGVAEIVDAHTIRVMCKAATPRVKQPEGKPPTN